MEESSLWIVLLVAGLITFLLGLEPSLILAEKPASKIIRHRNLLWILSNVFFGAGLFLRYEGGHDTTASVMALLAANFAFWRQKKRQEK